MEFSKIVILAVILSLLNIGCTSNAQEAKQKLIDKSISDLKEVEDTSSESDKDYVKGEILVGFNNDVDFESTIAEMEKYEGVALIKMLMDAKDARIAHFKVPVGEEKSYITVFSKNKNIKYVEPNMTGTFINPIADKQSATLKADKSVKKAKAKPHSGDKIVGIWEVKNDFYMAVYEIQKYKGKYVGLVHYYNDGKEEVKGDGGKDYYFMENVTYNNGKYENGKMHMPDGSKYDVSFVLKNENQLEAKMKIEGQPYTEIWKRKV